MAVTRKIKSLRLACPSLASCAGRQLSLPEIDFTPIKGLNLPHCLISSSGRSLNIRVKSIPWTIDFVVDWTRKKSASLGINNTLLYHMIFPSTQLRFTDSHNFSIGFQKLTQDQDITKVESLQSKSTEGTGISFCFGWGNGNLPFSW